MKTFSQVSSGEISQHDGSVKLGYDLAYTYVTPVVEKK